MNSKLETFRASVKERQNIVVCAKCGSTAIDQNSIHNLMCYDCGNTAFWDAKRFGIARNSEEQDAVSTFRVEGRTVQPAEGTWRSEMISGLEPLAHLLPQLTLIFDTDFGQIKREDFDAAAKQWAQTKAALDATFTKLLTSEDAMVD